MTNQDGTPVPGASVLLKQAGGAKRPLGETPNSGIAAFRLAPGTYTVLIEKSGFYSTTVEKVIIAAGQTTQLEFVLHQIIQRKEHVEVTEQVSPIDPQQTFISESLKAEEIAEIPYPTERDYRNVLQFVPGVIRDDGGQVHVAGGNAQQTQDYLDGFEISQPAGGLALRLNPDALQKIRIQSSRYSSQYGKGSAGLAEFETRNAGNRYWFYASDFFPTFQTVKGLNFNNWTPRVSVSGPLRENKAWFLLSHEGEYDLNIVEQLPDGADRNRVWRTSDLAKFKVNLSQSNSVIVDAILNLFDSQHAGISQFNPVSASVNQKSSLSFLGARDQISIARNALFEFGFGFLHSRSTEVPLGSAPFTITPDGNEGNFYHTTATWSERLQGFANFFLPPVHWYGHHQFAVGGELARVTLSQQFERNPILFTDPAGALVRESQFQNLPGFTLHTVEPSLYLQDRWSPASRLVIEAGLRWDADSRIDRNLISPRLVGAYLLDKASETKLSAGVGVYYDRTNLNLLGRSLQGPRTDFFFATDSSLGHAPILTSFVAFPRELPMPKFTNSSVGVERRLPARIYARLDYLRRRGTGGWAYQSQASGISLLENAKQDHYGAVQLTLRKEIKRGYPVLVSYTRSSARTNAFLDFGPDSPTFGSQVSGPQPWDAPNQLVSWGVLPLFGKLKKFDFAYSALWRTGFPFVTVNDFLELVDGPAAHRFPDFFTLNPAVERKFIFRGYRWVARVGIDNLTNSQNPTLVNNITSSSFFLTFDGLSHRTLQGHIRFLGRR